MNSKRASFLKVTRIYLLLPLVVMLVFIFYYRSWQQSELAAQQQERAQLQIEEQHAAEKRKAMEDQMSAESQHLRELREKALQEKEQAEVEERQNKIKQLKKDLANSSEQLANTQKELADATASLEKTRAARLAAEKEVFERSVAVEKLRVVKNQTDLECQRLNDMALDFIVSAPMP